MANVTSEKSRDPWQAMGRMAAFRNDFTQSFSVLTFPPMEMFLQPVDGLEAVLRWYQCLETALMEFQKSGTPFFDERKIVRFPLDMPFSGFFAVDGIAALSQRHHDICSQVRMGTLSLEQGKQNPETGQLLRHACTTIRNQMQAIRDLMKNRAPLPPTEHSPVHIGSLLASHIQAHRQWLERYQEHMLKVLEHGALRWEYAKKAGDFITCTLGQAFSRHDGIFWPILHLEPVHKLNDAHKHFHASLAVEVEVINALRSRGLTPVELDKLRKMILARRDGIRRMSRELIDLMPSAFDLILNRATDQPIPTRMATLPPITYSQMVAGIQNWGNRIRKFVEDPHDPGISQILLHTECPTGQRIHQAMADPVRLKTYENPLQAMESVHLQTHITATVVVVLTWAGYTDEARTMLSTLQRDERRLIEFIQKTGDIIGVM
ncbi:MAG: hypothetical protein H7833_14265 [Magnetococcus sp. DMHC-1]